MERWLRRLTTMGFTRGMRGSRPWMITAMIAVGLRALRRMSHPAPEVLYRTKVSPGDTFEIVARPQLTGRKARRAAQ
jgi:hypothetical protein